MTKHMTPLSTLLGLATIAAAAPDLFGPSAMVDRRTHMPANDTGHAPMTPTKMADPLRGATMGADGLGGTGGFNGEMLIDGDKDATGHLSADTASLVEIEEAVGAVDTDAELS